MSAALAHPLPREERLRTIAGLRGTPAMPMTAWRGRSGRRYVAGIHPLAAAEFDDIGPAVVLAVYRDLDGRAWLVTAAITDDLDVPDFMAQAAAGHATELHAHRLAETEANRRALVSDLLPANEVL